MKTHIKREHFGITTTNKRHYSTFEAQRVIQKLAELTSKKAMNEELPLKRSANSAFSSLPTRRQHEPVERQRHLGRASLDISQFPPLYYNANCMQVSCLFTSFQVYNLFRSNQQLIWCQLEDPLIFCFPICTVIGTIDLFNKSFKCTK